MPWRKISSVDCFDVSPRVNGTPDQAEGGFGHPLRPHGLSMLVLTMALACIPGSLIAVQVHECKGSDGVVRFQDSPCLAGETSRIRRLSGDPIQAAQVPAPMADTSVVHEFAETGTSLPQAPASPPSSTYLCQREDGSRYVSDSGIGNRHAIPLGMMGYPPMSLAEAYGGANGIGVSAPGVRPVPVVPGRRGSAAGLQTWVEDPCARVTGAPLCNFYTSQLEDAQRRLRFAFSDTTKKVQTEINDWRARVASCRR